MKTNKTKRKNPVIAAMGRKGGRAGKGQCKSRGDANHYKRLAKLRWEGVRP
jgi:hypothetical protein